MCQSQAQGGRRCASATRHGYRDALDAVLSAQTADEARAARDAGRAAVVAHAKTPNGRAEIQEETERVHDTRRTYPDGLATATWLAQCGFEADEENRRAAEANPEEPAPVVDFIAAFEKATGRTFEPRPDRRSDAQYEADEARVDRHVAALDEYGRR